MRKPVFVLLCLVPCILGFTSANAQADLGLKAVGGELGLVGPDNTDIAFGFGLFADLGTFHPNVGWEAVVDYWQVTESAFGLAETSFRDIAFRTRAKYLFHTANPKLTPYLGAGLGIHMLRMKATIPEQNFGGIIIPGMEVSDTETRLGLDLGGGLTTSVSPRVDFSGEFWYSFIEDVNHFSFKLGLGYRLGI